MLLTLHSQRQRQLTNLFSFTFRSSTTDQLMVQNPSQFSITRFDVLCATFCTSINFPRSPCVGPGVGASLGTGVGPSLGTGIGGGQATKRPRVEKQSTSQSTTPTRCPAIVSVARNDHNVPLVFRSPEAISAPKFTSQLERYAAESLDQQAVERLRTTVQQKR